MTKAYLSLINESSNWEDFVVEGSLLTWCCACGCWNPTLGQSKQVCASGLSAAGPNSTTPMHNVCLAPQTWSGKQFNQNCTQLCTGAFGKGWGPVWGRAPTGCGVCDAFQPVDFPP